MGGASRVDSIGFSGKAPPFPFRRTAVNHSTTKANRPKEALLSSCRLRRGSRSLLGHLRLLYSNVSGLAPFCDTARSLLNHAVNACPACKSCCAVHSSGSSTARWRASWRSSIRRGARRHRIGGAASQALERAPAPLRPQARFRASVVHRLRQSSSAGRISVSRSVALQLEVEGSSENHAWRPEACDPLPSARRRTCRRRAADPPRPCGRATSRA